MPGHRVPPFVPPVDTDDPATAAHAAQLLDNLTAELTTVQDTVTNPVARFFAGANIGHRVAAVTTYAPRGSR